MRESGKKVRESWREKESCIDRERETGKLSELALRENNGTENATKMRAQN